jgi:transcriptional regulator with XRE-family HTH domain
MPPQKTKHYRGVILTRQGCDRFQAAKTQAELNENAGNRFTQEELSDRMDLSLTTISKVLRRSAPVDEQSLQRAFRAFGLELSKHDYTRPGAANAKGETLPNEESSIQLGGSDWEIPIDTYTFCGRNQACSPEVDD